MTKLTEPDKTLVFTVHNAHTRACGSPPGIEADPNDGLYRGYFENECGEQWVVEIDRGAKMGTLRGGDIGWDSTVPIRDNEFISRACCANWQPKAAPSCSRHTFWKKSSR